MAGHDNIDRLQDLHRELGALLAELDQATRADLPDPALLSSIRYRLSRASRARSMLIDALYPELLARAAPDQASRLEALRAEGARLRAQSTEHIGSWTIEAAVERWPAYRDASERMRAAMRARIAQERSLLYPLLSGDTP